MKKLITINIVLVILLCTIPKPQKKKPIEFNPNGSQTITNRSERPEYKPEYKEITSVSEQGIDFIKKYEGCRLQAYKLKGEKNFTIGYGHNSSDIFEGQKITQEQANEIFENDIIRYSNYVLDNCKHLKLNQNEFDALVSFTYNCGVGNLQKLIRNRNKQQIADKMTLYTKSASESNRAGLLKRRTAEKNIFLGGKINEK